MTPEEFYYWAKSYFDLVPKSSDEPLFIEVAREKIKKVEPFLISFPFKNSKKRIYITIEDKPLWNGRQYSGLTLIDEDKKILSEKLGVNLNDYDVTCLIENGLNPNHEKIYCKEFTANENKDGMSGLPIQGPGIANVGNSLLIC